jgi:hypothetical protein
MTKKIALLAACAAAGCFAVLAIAPSQAASANDPGAQSVSPSPNSSFAKQPGTLSDKLDASNGVIRPKEVDPKIEKPAPSTGSTAVIPPPGSPGVPQGVQPK